MAERRYPLCERRRLRDERHAPSRNGIVNPDGCAQRVHNLSLHTTVSYQAAEHFWLIQTIESVVFFGLAGLLIFAA